MIYSAPLAAGTLPLLPTPGIFLKRDPLGFMAVLTDGNSEVSPSTGKMTLHGLKPMVSFPIQALLDQNRGSFDILYTF